MGKAWPRFFPDATAEATAHALLIEAHAILIEHLGVGHLDLFLAHRRDPSRQSVLRRRRSLGNKRQYLPSTPAGGEAEADLRDGSHAPRVTLPLAAQPRAGLQWCGLFQICRKDAR